MAGGGHAGAQVRDARARDARLRDVVARTSPVVHAGDQVLPVVPALQGLLPWAGLRRGATVAVERDAGTGARGAVTKGRGVGTGGLDAGGAGGGAATSLALALVAGASQAGSWCAAVGLPSLGLVAAVEAGIDLARFPMVSTPSSVREWASVVAAVVDAFDVVLACPPARVHGGDARRLVARARERGAALVVLGGPWDGADVRLSVRGATWEGLGHGYGRLCARRVEVAAVGRGAAAKPRTVSLWLPDSDGRVRQASASASAPRRPGHATGRKEVRVAG